MDHKEYIVMSLSEAYDHKIIPNGSDYLITCSREEFLDYVAKRKNTKTTQINIMKKNYRYDFLLPFFAASNDLRPAIKHIHKDADGYIYATDAHIMIRIPADKVGNEYKAIEKFPNAGKLVSEALSRPGNISRSIAVDDLIMVLSKAKWYKEMQTRQNPPKTPKCYTCKVRAEDSEHRNLLIKS